MGYRVQYRRDTAARWAEINPILLDGEIGYVKDNPNQYKMGDGIHAWNDLPLRGFDGTIAPTLGYNDDAVLSQRIVTEKFDEQDEKLSELGSKVDSDISSITGISNLVFPTKGSYHFSYRIISGNTYEITNNSDGGVSVYTSNESDGSNIETISTSLSSGKTITFLASFDASYIRGYGDTKISLKIVDKSSSSVAIIEKQIEYLGEQIKENEFVVLKDNIVLNGDKLKTVKFPFKAAKESSFNIVNIGESESSIYLYDVDGNVIETISQSASVGTSLQYVVKSEGVHYIGGYSTTGYSVKLSNLMSPAMNNAIEQAKAEIPNGQYTFQAESAGRYSFRFDVKKGNTYIITNLSTIEASVYTSNESYGDNIETISTSMPINVPTKFTATSDALFIKGYGDSVMKLLIEDTSNPIYRLEKEVSNKQPANPILTNFEWHDGYIHFNASGGIRDSEILQYCSPIAVKTGYKIFIKMNFAGSATILAKYDNGSYTKIFGSTSTEAVDIDYEYVVEEDMQISICVVKDNYAAYIDSNIYYASKEEVDELRDAVSDFAIVPSYYHDNGYIDGKIREIRAAMSNRLGCCFGFLTDLHISKTIEKSGNAGHAFALFKYVMDRLNVPFILCGGDIPCTRLDSWEEIIGCGETLYQMMAVVGQEKVYQTRGNHDYLGYVGDGTDVEHCTPNELYPIVTGNHYNVVRESGKMYYYFDTSENLRVIVLDDYEGNDTDDKIGGVTNISQNQYDWIVNTALNCSGKNILFFSHQTADSNIGTLDDSNRPMLHKLLVALKNKTILNESIGGITLNHDFTNDTNDLLFHLTGHVHEDKHSVTDNVLTIAQTCDCYSSYLPQGNYEGRDKNTITEHAISVFCVDYVRKKIVSVRIGSGENQEFYY